MKPSKSSHRRSRSTHQRTCGAADDAPLRCRSHHVRSVAADTVVSKKKTKKKKKDAAGKAQTDRSGNVGGKHPDGCACDCDCEFDCDDHTSSTAPSSQSSSLDDSPPARRARPPRRSRSLVSDRTTAPTPARTETLEASSAHRRPAARGRNQRSRPGRCRSVQGTSAMLEQMENMSPAEVLAFDRNRPRFRAKKPARAVSLASSAVLPSTAATNEPVSGNDDGSHSNGTKDGNDSHCDNDNDDCASIEYELDLAGSNDEEDGVRNIEHSSNNNNNNNNNNKKKKKEKKKKKRSGSKKNRAKTTDHDSADTDDDPSSESRHGRSKRASRSLDKSSSKRASRSVTDHGRSSRRASRSIDAGSRHSERTSRNAPPDHKHRSERETRSVDKRSHRKSRSASPVLNYTDDDIADAFMVNTQSFKSRINPRHGNIGNDSHKPASDRKKKKSRDSSDGASGRLRRTVSAENLDHSVHDDNSNSNSHGTAGNSRHNWYAKKNKPASRDGRRELEYRVGKGLRLKRTKSPTRESHISKVKSVMGRIIDDDDDCDSNDCDSNKRYNLLAAMHRREQQRQASSAPRDKSATTQMDQLVPDPTDVFAPASRRRLVDNRKHAWMLRDDPWQKDYGDRAQSFDPMASISSIQSNMDDSMVLASPVHKPVKFVPKQKAIEEAEPEPEPEPDLGIIPLGKPMDPNELREMLRLSGPKTRSQRLNSISLEDTPAHFRDDYGVNEALPNPYSASKKTSVLDGDHGEALGSISYHVPSKGASSLLSQYGSLHARTDHVRGQW